MGTDAAASLITIVLVDVLCLPLVFLPRRCRKAGKTMDEAEVWRWLVQLLLALSYVHSKKILHRDVKTQNIFLSQVGGPLSGSGPGRRLLLQQPILEHT